MQQYLTMIHHNLAVLASLTRHQSVRLRTECGRLEHELRTFSSLRRALTSDSRKAVLAVVTDTVTGLEQVRALRGDVRSGTTSAAMLDEFAERLRALIADAVRGIVILETSHYDGDVNVQLTVQSELARLVHLFPETRSTLAAATSKSVAVVTIAGSPRVASPAPAAPAAAAEEVLEAPPAAAAAAADADDEGRKANDFL